MYVAAVFRRDPTGDSDQAAGRQGRNLVLRAFAFAPTLSATAWSVIVFGWIAVGTAIAAPLGGSSAQDFVRDGVVRWPGAAMVLAILWLIRAQLPINLVALPSASPVVERLFPWATITLVVVAGVRLSVVTQFWRNGTFTAATFFSELSTGVFEELAFRGLIFSGLLYGLGQTASGVRKSALITTVLFGVVHASGGWAAVAVTALFGAVFLVSTLELRSLWPAALLHGLFDVGVNGGASAGVGTWRPTLTGFASAALLLAGAAGLIILLRWTHWPVVGVSSTGDAHKSASGEPEPCRTRPDAERPAP